MDDKVETKVVFRDEKKFIDMKSKKVMSKPPFDEYIHELCHQKISKKALKKFHFGNNRVHARMIAAKMPKKAVEKMIGRISERLY